jgi:hypothetical protein
VVQFVSSTQHITPYVYSDSELGVTLPSAAACSSFTASIALASANGTSQAYGVVLAFPAGPPLATGLSQSSSSPGGWVYVLGQNFICGGETTVSVGGVEVSTEDDYEDWQVGFTVPSNVPRNIPLNVSVTTPSGQSTSPVKLTVTL